LRESYIKKIFKKREKEKENHRLKQSTFVVFTEIYHQVEKPIFEILALKFNLILGTFLNESQEQQ